MEKVFSDAEIGKILRRMLPQIADAIEAAARSVVGTAQNGKTIRPTDARLAAVGAVATVLGDMIADTYQNTLPIDDYIRDLSADIKRVVLEGWSTQIESAKAERETSAAVH